MGSFRCLSFLSASIRVYRRPAKFFLASHDAPESIHPKPHRTRNPVSKKKDLRHRTHDAAQHRLPNFQAWARPRPGRYRLLFRRKKIQTPAHGRRKILVFASPRVQIRKPNMLAHESVRSSNGFVSPFFILIGVHPRSSAAGQAFPSPHDAPESIHRPEPHPSHNPVSKKKDLRHRIRTPRAEPTQNPGVCVTATRPAPAPTIWFDPRKIASRLTNRPRRFSQRRSKNACLRHLRNPSSRNLGGVEKERSVVSPK